MADDSPQLEMLGSHAEELSIELQEETTRRCKSWLEALQQSVRVSGLNDQRIYGPLGLSQGQWSKIWNGQKFLDPERYDEFMRLCGNQILLRYMARTAKHYIEPMRTDDQERITELERENAELRRAMQLWGKYMKGEM